MIKRVFVVLSLILFVQASPVTMSGKVGHGIRSNGGHGTSANGGKTFNLVTDFGAICNGTSSDGPAFMAAGVAMRAFQAANPHMPVTLVIPPGSSCSIAGALPAPDTGRLVPFENVENFTFIVTNATLLNQFGQWGTGGFVGSNGSVSAVSSNFNANLVGDTCVTMTTPGQEVNFPVGNWVTVAGQGIQVNSFPPNYVNWEYAQVASTGSGKVCLKAPLKHVYPSVQLDLSLANCSNIYCGGPGRLVLMDSSWSGYWHIIGGTWNSSIPFSLTSRTLILDNVTIVGNDTFQNCNVPSTVQTITYNNVNINCNHIEVDKEIDAMIINGGSIGGFVFQSLSVNSITLTAGASVGDTFGTPLATICNNSTIGNMRTGNSFGSLPQTFAGVNCNVPAVSAQFANNGFNPSSITSGAFVFTHFDIYNALPQWISTGGTMVMNTSTGHAPNADNEITIGVPNIPGFVPGSTDQTMLIPVTPNFGSTLPPPATGLGWQADQSRDMSCTSCTGARSIVDLNFPAAQHKPLFTYVNRTYTCANNIANVAGSYVIASGIADGWLLAGTWNSLSINVSVADSNPTDSGGSGLTLSPGFTFLTATGAETNNPGGQSTVNMLITGTRTIFATSTSGAQSGDTLAAPGANTWITEVGSQFAISGVTNGPAAQCPVVNVTWQTTR